MRCLLALVLTAVLGRTVAELERTFRVPESARAGHVVGHLQYSPSAPDKVNFYIVFPPESGVEDALAVSDTTGEIRTRSALDYETKSSYVFLAIPTDGSAGIRVTVSVIDENDNAPVFPVPSIDVQLSEYARVNAEMPLPSATDADFDNFGVQEYRIASGNVNNAFRLATRKLNGILYVDLIVNAELDREYRDRYQLAVEAVDGGNPPKIGQLLVNVSIIDANDNPPQFSQPRYLAHIERNTTVGTAVIAVSATDADIGPNGQVEYRLLPNPGDSHKRFSVDPKSGTISLAEPLTDQPAVKNYELLVVARDFGQPLPLESTAFVTVTIMNNKDGAAKIRTIYLSQEGTSTVSEGAQIGDMVARFSVDWDGREHMRAARSTVNMTLSGGGSFFSLQAADAAVFVLVVTKRLDRETLAAFDLMVIATDSNGRLAHQNLTLLVTDVNDNAPRFTEAVYEAEVREKSPKGSSVIRVTANDADEGDNARMSYTLSASPPFDKWFQIDADTGLVTSLHAVDCEVSSKPELVVVATDHGRPPLSAKAKIVVSVLDINDNSPLFEKSVYNASLAEDTEVGTCFLKVQATDPDCGVNANVRYSLVDHPSTKRVFSIDDATGTICLDAPLDFEQRRRYQLTVIAQDGGGLSSTALVDVHVEDRDDNAPIFYPSMYNISVRENAPTGSPLLIVSATDRDEGLFGQITYRLSSASPLFRIDARSGELYVQGQLFPDIYKLGVLATDGGGMSSVEPAAVNVAVLREGFVSPNFESKIYRFTASEDTMPGISIGRVKATGPEPIVYDVYSGDPNGEFKVDRTTGELLIVKYIDADERQSVLLNIQAAMGTPPSYNHTQVIISIEDVNDNSPEFEMAVVKTTVREDQPAHEPFFAVQATDKDRHKNGEITYRLLSSDPVGPFLVRPLSGQISLTNKIDYEAVNFYRLVIGAIDGGIPPRSANITVELSLLDENDHPPKFVIDAYHVEIAEDVRAMTNLVQLNATDQDTGPNGEVSFGLKDDADGLFGIMADSGWVYVRKSLDRETKPEHIIIATATDHGDPPKSSQSSITIVLKDVNDRSPNCTSVGPYTTLENAPANTLIGVIRATDPDLGENGTVFYRLDRSYGDLFRIESSGEIYSKKPLDAETQNEYRIDVTAQDNGSPQLSTNCQIVIHVLDLNDNAPYFILPHQNKVSIREEQPIGTEVVQVRASDPDQGANGTITYSLVGTGLGASVFRIDGKTGVVTTAAVLDFESLSLSPSGSLELTVKATDGGGLEATKTLIIEIVDVADKARAGSIALITGNDAGNDNVSVAFEVSESAPVGTKLGPLDHARADQLAKVDGNNIDGKLLDVTFDIVSGNSQGLFEIDRLSSVIYVVSRLDYETSPSHALRIARTDLSRPNLPVISYVSVNVGVLEENDNAPEFLEDPVIFSVAEDAKEGLVVWRFNATDRDVGANGRLLYRIVEQTPVKSFDIEPVTGELWLSQRLDRETVSDYLVIVEASDQAAEVSKRRTSKATARVYVTDVNDNVARFTSHDSVVVYEDEIVGSPFFFVVAKDDDWLDNGRVGYKLTSGNDAGFFAINQTTGALSLTKRLNRDSERSFQLGIEAFDDGQEPRSNRQLLTVTVESMNEDAPRFQQSVYRVNVSENAPVGTLVTRLTATDARGATLLFVLPTEGSFALDATTGNLVTTVALDREQQNDYSFTVFVQDAKEEHRYDSASVNVHVGDLNDNAPVLAIASCQSVSVSENVRYDTLHRFIAFDNDTDINGLVTFSIQGGNDDNKFHVNASTGVLSCEPLDRETKAAYNLTIVAKDNGQPSLQDTCLFQVNVIDQNDMHPVFEKESYEIEVPENTAAGVVVIRLKAIDHDQGKNGQVLYSLVGESSGQFEIEPVTGDLFVVGRLDYERRNVYTLTVRAMDEGVTEAKYSDANLTLTVTDMNDNAPQFANVPIRVNLPTEVASGQLIVQVSAFDQDSIGPNSAVSYGFTEPSTEFAIDSATGIISAQRSMSMLEGANRYLMVTATDNGTPHLSSTGIAEITFGTGTRHPLSIEFNQQIYKADLPESALGGQLVVMCLARRYSNGESDGITYNIVAGNELQAFGIENWSGKVFVADVNKMRSERSRRYSLLVEASASIVNEDNTDAQRLAFALVEIHLVDGADVEPQFLQQRYSTSVSEAKARGEFVIQVAASHRNMPEDARLTYSIVRGNLDSAFTIDETGTVKTNVELDREIQDSYNLTVTATDAQQPPKSTTTSVEVRVQDVNDNRPSFPPVRIVRVSEDTPVGTLLATVTANDVDADSILLYSFVPGVGDGAGMFEIDRLSGRILLAQPFDYERMVGYTLEIEVSDGANTARTGLKVLVDDENDNAPEFGQPFYQVSLPEDTPAESSIIQVHATDLDSADNGQITYRLLNYTDAGNVGFRINETTGAIYTEKALVPGLNKRLLTLLVSATDGGVPAQSALSIVQVRIVSRSEKMQPKFDKDFYSFTISENATLHDVVGQLALANSHDINGLMFGVKSGDPDRMFRIMGDGSISLARPVDREQRDEYHLEISVHTKSNSVANSSASVLIRIEDTNDNIPTFADPKMNVWLNESVGVGEAVLRLSATDRDAGDNGRVVYEMTSGNELGLLALDRTSGTLTLARTIKETDPVFSRFVVRASDQGSPPKSTIGSVSVNIKSNFKSGPFFPVPLYLGRIPESAPVGTLVFTAKATDREGKHLAKLQYSFEQLEDNDAQSEGKKTSLFSINELSGELRTNAIFDYEQKSSYRLSITVKDGAGRSAVVPGQALIKGVDEYAPEFAQKSYAFKVSFDIKPGSVIGSIFASDKDAGADGQVSYSLKEPTAYFAINAATGVLTVEKSLKELSSKSAVPQSSRSIRSTVSQDDPLKGEITAPKISVVYLTVVAASGVNPTEGMRSEASIVLNLGFFAIESAENAAAFDATIITVVSIILILLLVLVLLFLIFKLRRRKDKNLGRKAAPGTKNVTLPKKKSGPHAGIYAPSTAQSVMTLASAERDRLAPTFHCHPSPVKTAGQPRETLPAPPLPPVGTMNNGRRAPLNSTSAFSNKSSGDEDDELRRLTSRNTDRSAREMHARSMPDSGIDVYVDEDSNSLASSEVPSAREYLTSLGVTEPSVHNRQNINQVVAGGRAEALEMNSAAAARLADDDEADLNELIYSKVNQVLAEDGDRSGLSRPLPDASRLTLSTPPDPMFNSGGTLGRRLKVQQTQPSYQPLTQVFSEISRLRNGSERRPPMHYHSTPVHNTTGRQSPWTPNFVPPVSPTSSNGFFGRDSCAEQNEVEIKI